MNDESGRRCRWRDCAGRRGRREKYKRAHIQHTVQLDTLPLDEHDLVYLSELVDFPDRTIPDLAYVAGIQPLDMAEIENQMTLFAAPLCFRTPRYAPGFHL